MPIFLLIHLIFLGSFLWIVNFVFLIDFFASAVIMRLIMADSDRLGFVGVEPKVLPPVVKEIPRADVNVLEAFTPIKGTQVGEKDGELGSYFRNVGWEFKGVKLDGLADVIPVLGMLNIKTDIDTTHNSDGTPHYYDNHVFEPKSNISDGVEYKVYGDSQGNNLQLIGILDKDWVGNGSRKIKTGERFVVVAKVGGREGYYQMRMDHTGSEIKVISADDFQGQLSVKQ